MPPPPGSGARVVALAERALVAAVAVWLAIFTWLKLAHVLSPTWIEWDARAMALAAFRFHGSGLFPRDLGVDLSAAMCPPGWKLLYWLGSLAVDPYQVSRLLPLGLLAFLAWQAFAFARPRGGVVIAAATVFLVVRCPFFWDRMVGANPRGFGLPLVVAFVRYACDRRPRAAALVLVAQAAFYPSVMLFCAPAFAILQLVEAWRRRDRGPILLTALCGAACFVLILPTVFFIDPRLGSPITLAELATLKQRSIWALYPLLPHGWVFWRAVHLALEDAVEAPPALGALVPIASAVLWGIAAGAFVVALVRRRLPLPLPIAAGAAVAMYAVAYAVAYRLYVPDRMVHYSLVPLILVPLLPLVHDALTLVPARLLARGRALVATVPILALTLAAGGWGLARHNGLRDWGGQRSPAIDFLATRPTDALVAAHPVGSSFVEVFAHRSTLFSGITNAPNFARYGRTIEQRIEAFYEAYYARSLDAVRAFARREGVDYLVVDERDFGKDAFTRARYVSPWTEVAMRRIAAAQGAFALAQAPPDAIAFRAGPLVVLDAKKL